MVGFIDPNPPKKQPEKPQTEERRWKGTIMNPIQLRRPAQGKYSPKTDERCFTWCSQSVRGRAEGQDPWCRSICIRRVFEHEVRQLTSHFSQDAAYHSRISRAASPQSSSSPSASATTSSSGSSSPVSGPGPGPGSGPPLKYPLPPEGQRSFRLFGDLLDDDDDDDNNDRYYGRGKEKGENTKYWEEGWYIWMTKNRWAAQEKMDLMMLDLEKQTNWNKVKEQEERAWEESQAQLEKEKERKEREGQDQGQNEQSVVGPSGADADTSEERHQLAPIRFPYAHATEESFLVRIPTRLDLASYANATFNPTRKVLSIVRQSFENGDQKELALRAAEAVQTGAPFRLVRNVFKTCFDSLKKGPRDGDGEGGEE